MGYPITMAWKIQGSWSSMTWMISGYPIFRKPPAGVSLSLTGDSSVWLVNSSICITSGTSWGEYMMSCSKATCLPSSNQPCQWKILHLYITFPSRSTFSSGISHWHCHVWLVKGKSEKSTLPCVASFPQPLFPEVPLSYLRDNARYWTVPTLRIWWVSMSDSHSWDFQLPWCCCGNLGGSPRWHCGIVNMARILLCSTEKHEETHGLVPCEECFVRPRFQFWFGEYSHLLSICIYLWLIYSSPN